MTGVAGCAVVGTIEKLCRLSQVRSFDCAVQVKFDVTSVARETSSCMNGAIFLFGQIVDASELGFLQGADEKKHKSREDKQRQMGGVKLRGAFAGGSTKGWVGDSV